jgi:very-short-patch-repair endonuclease
MELKGWKQAKHAARADRRQLSPAEVRLWQELRKQPDGHRFRRQHPAGPYRIDFHCARAKLAIEVDGEAPGYGNRPERDALRDAWLAQRGVVTLRVPASEVMNNLEGVLQHILAAVAARG